jgi:hypothetical protein
MPTLATKLRRDSTTKQSSTTAQVNTLWRGIDIHQLAETVSANCLQQKLWKSLVQLCTMSYDDHAIALVQYHLEGRRTIIAEDGLHDTLKKVILEPHTTHPFLLTPQTIIANISQNMAADDERRKTYEFIEHYWGWQVWSDQKNPIFLMFFGPDNIEPSEHAHSLAKLVRFICEHTETARKKIHLASDLLAETQGMRISPSAALAKKLENWVNRDGR